MKNFYIFEQAVYYMEDNLCNPITQEDIAAACFCSLSSLQKIWKYCTSTSLKVYLSKRRLTCSARDLMNTDLSVTEIAFKYQYNSPEVFTRAFSKLWGVSPSKFKHQWRFFGIYPKYIPNESAFEIGGNNFMPKKHVDISELYDTLSSMKGTYVLCFDIVGLDPINKNLGHNAGDKVILEAFKRLNDAAEDNMMVFRIGGDEFAVITGYDNTEDTETFAQKILDRNSEVIAWDEGSIPVAMHCGAYQMSSSTLRYEELFHVLQDTLNRAATADYKDNTETVHFYN